jgi:PAS domain S-box-containing protein
MAQMFGYSDEEILSANVTNFFPDKEVRQEVARRLRQGKIVKVPMLQLRRKDGTLFYANLIESILTLDDQEVLLGIVDDITEQVLAEQTLQAQAEETAVAAERTRIAAELHDSVTQTLYTISLIAEALPAVWETHPDEAKQSLGELRSLTVGALAEMRTLLLELRPGTLADRSLSELLHQLADAMSTRTEMPITTTVVGQCSAPEDVQMALYRIAQESLNNITKHARASRAWVNLNCVTNGVTLRIGDNGRGFDPLARQPHELGLDIMHGRAEAIGAEFSITSEPSQGTEIVVEWAGTREFKDTNSNSHEDRDDG